MMTWKHKISHTYLVNLHYINLKTGSSVICISNITSMLLYIQSKKHTVILMLLGTMETTINLCSIKLINPVWSCNFLHKRQ